MSNFIPPDYRAAFVVLYFGTWPNWFPAYLRSCETNVGVKWLIVTDSTPPAFVPPNVSFLNMTLDEIKDRCERCTEIRPSIERMYKLCDLRPFYGLLFSDLLNGFKYWGFCDLDIIWGDIDNWLKRVMLSEPDIISARKGKLAGHCSLFRNTEEINTLPLTHPIVKDVLLNSESYYFDEVGFTEILKPEVEAGRLSAHWPRFEFNFANRRRFNKLPPSRLGPSRNGWAWHKGRLFDHTQGMPTEVLYLHFMTWKSTLTSCDFTYGEQPDSFYISHTHISKSPNKSIPWSWKNFRDLCYLYMGCFRGWLKRVGKH